jgi:hypothetical protein
MSEATRDIRSSILDFSEELNMSRCDALKE